MDDTLDQAFTSAGFAMKFAADNWQEFCEWAERITGRPVPIDSADMLRAGLRITLMADPERMPRG